MRSIITDAEGGSPILNLQGCRYIGVDPMKIDFTHKKWFMCKYKVIIYKK